MISIDATPAGTRRGFFLIYNLLNINSLMHKFPREFSISGEYVNQPI